MAEGRKEVIEKNLRLTLFVAGDVSGAPSDEFLKHFPIRHGRVLHEGGAGGNDCVDGVTGQHDVSRSATFTSLHAGWQMGRGSGVNAALRSSVMGDIFVGCDRGF